MTTATDTSRFDELDYRENDGIQVSLVWSRDDNRLAVLVVDTKTDETFELSVRPERLRTSSTIPTRTPPHGWLQRIAAQISRC